MAKIISLALVLVGMVMGLELNGINAEVKGNTLVVSGKSYRLARDVVVESLTGARLEPDGLKYARAIKIEFNQAGEAKLIKILGWWD